MTQTVVYAPGTVTVDNATGAPPAKATLGFERPPQTEVGPLQIQVGYRIAPLDRCDVGFDVTVPMIGTDLRCKVGSDSVAVGAGYRGFVPGLRGDLELWEARAYVDGMLRLDDLDVNLSLAISRGRFLHAFDADSGLPDPPAVRHVVHRPETRLECAASVKLGPFLVGVGPYVVLSAGDATRGECWCEPITLDQQLGLAMTFGFAATSHGEGQLPSPAPSPPRGAAQGAP